MALSPEAIAAAKELTRRRVMLQDANVSSDYAVALAEVAVLDRYGLALNVLDLTIRRNKVTIQPTDESGRIVRILPVTHMPVRVYSRLLDSDIFVFVKPEKSGDPDILGWLSSDLLQEAPVKWFVQNGERKDYSHEVAQDFLQRMPETFDFVGCPHTTKYGAIWDDRRQGWECFGCGQRVYDDTNRDRIERYTAENGAADKANSAGR